MKSKMNSNMRSFMQGKDIATVLFGEMKTPDRSNLSEAIYKAVLIFKGLMIAYEVGDPAPHITIGLYDSKRGVIWHLLMEACLIWNDGGYGAIPSTRFMCDWVYRRVNLARN